jgi:tetratricopeptide (TPR) repeat protein
MLDERRLDRARRYFEQAIGVAPQDPWLITDLALVDHTDGQHVRALDQIDRALALDSDNPWALRTKARILADVGAFTKAVEVLNKVLEVSLPVASVYQSLGWLLENASPDRIPDAHDAYVKAAELDDRDLWIRRGLADTLATLRGAAAAREHYQWVVSEIERQVDPDIDTVALLGWCRYGLGHYDGAIRTYVSALSGGPMSIETGYLHFDFGLALLASGQADLALSEYRRGILQITGGTSLRQRGLLLVALGELAGAGLRGTVEGRDAAAARGVLDEALVEAEKGLDEQERSVVS